MQRIRRFVAALAGDQRGLTTVEYAIILCVIVSVAVGIWDTFGENTRKALKTSTEDIGKAYDPGAE